MPDETAATPAPDRDRIRARATDDLRAGRFAFQVVERLVADYGLAEPEAEAIVDQAQLEERDRVARAGRDWVPPMPRLHTRAAGWLRGNWPLAAAAGLVVVLFLLWLLGGVRWLAGLLLSR